jgi:hypothetical protein
MVADTGDGVRTTNLVTCRVVSKVESVDRGLSKVTTRTSST